MRLQVRMADKAYYSRSLTKSNNRRRSLLLAEAGIGWHLRENLREWESWRACASLLSRPISRGRTARHCRPNSAPRSFAWKNEAAARIASWRLGERGESALFLQINRNTSYVVLDPDEPEGRR